MYPPQRADVTAEITDFLEISLVHRRVDVQVDFKVPPKAGVCLEVSQIRLVELTRWHVMTVFGPDTGKAAWQ